MRDTIIIDKLEKCECGKRPEAFNVVSHKSSLAGYSDPEWHLSWLEFTGSCCGKVTIELEYSGILLDDLLLLRMKEAWNRHFRVRSLVHIIGTHCVTTYNSQLLCGLTVRTNSIDMVQKNHILEIPEDKKLCKDCAKSVIDKIESIS